MNKNVFFLVGLLALAACATVEPVWRTIPESGFPYKKAWPIIVSTISNKFDIATIDANSGYLRTDWKTKKDMFGTPKTRTRMAVRTESKQPLKFSFRAEVESWNAFSESWTPKGNDPTIESDIQEEFASRLK